MQRVFIIDQYEEAAIYRTWRTRARNRLRDIFYDIHVKDVSTHWLMDGILQALRAHWASPTFKEKQLKAQASRGSTRGGFLHIGGSTIIKGMLLRMVNIIIFSLVFLFLY